MVCLVSLLNDYHHVDAPSASKAVSSPQKAGLNKFQDVSGSTPFKDYRSSLMKKPWDDGVFCTDLFCFIVGFTLSFA